MDRLNEAHRQAQAGLVDRFEIWPHFDERRQLRRCSLTMTIGEVQHLPVITFDRRPFQTAQSLLMECAVGIRHILGDRA